MSWTQLILESHEHQAPLLSRLLSEAGALSVTLTDGADDPLYEPAPGAEPLWRATRVTGLFDRASELERVLERVREGLTPDELPSYVIEPLADRDWEREWLTRFSPMCFGERLWVCPSGAGAGASGAGVCASGAGPPGPICVSMDPGLAFGTGTHETTALCLEWLASASIAGAEIIDYGCGSGILAIAAIKLGANHAWAVDNDPQALIASADNAARNAVAGAVRAVMPEQLASPPVDLVIANILANPLVYLAPRLSALVRPGGRLVLSGILVSQTEVVMDAYAGEFDWDPPARRGDWALVSACRTGRP